MVHYNDTSLLFIAGLFGAGICAWLGYTILGRPLGGWLGFLLGPIGIICACIMYHVS